MQLSELIPEYLAYRRSEGYKPNTVHADDVALNRMLRIVGDRDVRAVTPKMIDRVYDEMTERRLKSSTVNLATASMRSFFKWCIYRGHCLETPVLGRRYRRPEVRNMARIPIAQFEAFLDSARTPRDRMLLALGLFTMARKTEITGILMRDVDLDSGEINLYISKSNRYDRFPIGKRLRAELARWLPIYAQEVGPLEPDYFLVPAVQGGRRPNHDWPLRPRKQMVSPEDVVHYSLRAIGMDDSHHSGMHVLRRSSARAAFEELADRGYDGALRIVQATLRHHSSRDTEIYLGLELDTVKRDEIIREYDLFPSLAADNVVPFSHGQDRVAGM